MGLSSQKHVSSLPKEAKKNMHIVLSQKKEKCAMISSCLIAIQGVSVYTEDKIGNHIPFLLCHDCIDEDAAKGILPPCCLIVS